MDNNKRYKIVYYAERNQGAYNHCKYLGDLNSAYKELENFYKDFEDTFYGKVRYFVEENI